MEHVSTPANPSRFKTKLTLSNTLTVQDAPGAILDEIKKRLTMENPVYLENEKIGRWNGNTDRFLKYYRESSKGVFILPRGFIPQTTALTRQHDVRFEIEDRRPSLPAVDFIDSHVGVLKAAARARERVYQGQTERAS